jgi:hypothetical protein
MTSNDVNWLRSFFLYNLPNARTYSRGYHVNTQYLYSHILRLLSDLCLRGRLRRCAVGAILCTIVKADAGADEQAAEHLRTATPGQYHCKECGWNLRRHVNMLN